MLHLVLQRETRKPRYNISKRIGLGHAASGEEVCYLVFALRCSLQPGNGLWTADQKTKESVSSVQEGTQVCTGRPDDIVVKAIRAYQLHFSKTLVCDGYVSPLPNDGSEGFANMWYTLAQLHADVVHVTSDVFPRIDLSATCPPMLKAAFFKACSQKSIFE